MNILILANNDVGLYKFRKELIERFISIGYEVIISAPDGKYISDLQKLGCRYINTELDRRSVNPFKDIKILRSYIKKIKAENIDLVLTYTIKPNVYGGLACQLCHVPYIANITGLGTTIENPGVLQKIALFLYKVGLKKASNIFFQNQYNMNFFVQHKIIDQHAMAQIIPGSGVNIDENKLEPYPSTDDGVRFLFIGRVMKDKGIDELLTAAKYIKNKYKNTTFTIIGSFDEGYHQKINQYQSEDIIQYLGFQTDVHTFIKESHATILPSHHEGMANVLLESAACGRPVIASRIPGCSEAFDEGISGFGFEVKNVYDLIHQIIRFIELPHEQKVQMGLAGRKKMEKEFDRNIIVNAYLREIERITNETIQ